MLTAKHLPPKIRARTGEETNKPSQKIAKQSDRTASQLAVEKM
jgi:hypothetical protein